jgi:hypothetical protein
MKIESNLKSRVQQYYNKNFIQEKSKSNIDTDRYDTKDLLGYNKLINANHDKKVLVNFNKGIISVYVVDKFGERTKIDKHNTPKELIDINNAEKLDKYLDNTFALVSVSNNGDYSVKIERRCLGGMFGGDDKDKLYNSWSIPSQVTVSTPHGSIKMDTNMYTSVPDIITGGVTFDRHRMEIDASFAALTRSSDEMYKEMQKNREAWNSSSLSLDIKSPGLTEGLTRHEEMMGDRFAKDIFPYAVKTVNALDSLRDVVHLGEYDYTGSLHNNAKDAIDELMKK